MTVKKGPAGVAASLQLNTPSKRLYFVVGVCGLLLFMFGILLVILNRKLSSDMQYTLSGIGQWCMLVGPLTCVVGLFGSFLYDYTVRPAREAYERLTTWITAG